MHQKYCGLDRALFVYSSKLRSNPKLLYTINIENGFEMTNILKKLS